MQCSFSKLHPPHVQSGHSCRQRDKLYLHWRRCKAPYSIKNGGGWVTSSAGVGTTRCYVAASQPVRFVPFCVTKPFHPFSFTLWPSACPLSWLRLTLTRDLCSFVEVVVATLVPFRTHIKPQASGSEVLCFGFLTVFSVFSYKNNTCF